MAEIIIRAHDNREVNGVLEYQELKQWILEGSTLSPKERTTYRDLGENERLMTIFLEKVIQQSTYEAVSLEEEEDNQAQPVAVCISASSPKVHMTLELVH